MNIPESLKIGGHTIKVQFVSTLPDDVDGEYDNEKLTISISDRLPQSMKESTLFHEIMHALNGTFDADVTAHALLDSLSEQLYQVFSDNHLI